MLDLNLMLTTNLNACTIDCTYWEIAGSDCSDMDRQNTESHIVETQIT
jgi:hypothetical protein